MRTIIPEIVDRHAEEAAFLWLLRDNAVRAPHYKHFDLQRLDNRVEAHIDGLRIAGDDGWQIVWKNLEERSEPGEIFAAAVLAFENNNAERIARVLDIAVKKPELGRATAAALGWMPVARVAPLMGHALPAVRRIGLAGHAIRRLNPGAALEKALNDTDLSLHSRALKMVGEMGYGVWLPLLKKHLAIDHLPCRFQAARSAALLSGEPAAVAELQAIALTESGYRQRAAEIAIRRLDASSAQRWLTMLGTLPGGERIAIQAMTALGDPSNMPRLLQWMAIPALARVAGEAFTSITGTQLAEADLEGNAPDGFEAGPNEDALDENVSMDPDEGLPWPDVPKVSAWWNAHQGRYPKGVRHLAGKPLTSEWLLHVIAHERQRLRAAAAIDSFIANPKLPLVETRGR